MIKTGKELAAACVDVAKNYKTLYVTGCFGAPMNDYNKKRWIGEYAANAKEPRKSDILSASADTFGFDCVNLIKALLWGWNGDVNAEYGGVKYQSNGVPDIDEGVMFSQCTEQSTDFSKIEVGEAVWMKGHIGIYIGECLAVECTPAWSNNVQITACNCDKEGYNRRNWTKHGKLPYVEYPAKTKTFHRVQTGAYSNKTYAEEYMKKVKAAGFDVYMVKINGMYKIQVGAYENRVYAEECMKKVKAAGFAAFITTESGEPVSVKAEYTFTQFVMDVQKAIGAGVDGVPGPETLSKTVTLSRYTNKTHPAVIPVQKWLFELGYTEIGEADGEAGPAFEKAVTRYKRENGCYADGEIPAQSVVWKTLLKL